MAWCLLQDGLDHSGPLQGFDIPYDRVGEWDPTVIPPHDGVVTSPDTSLEDSDPQSEPMESDSEPEPMESDPESEPEESELEVELMESEPEEEESLEVAPKPERMIPAPGPYNNNFDLGSSKYWEFDPDRST